jgi:hypothetical protein
LGKRSLPVLIVRFVPVAVYVKEKVTVQNSYQILMEENRNKYRTRRDFVKVAGRMIIAAPLIYIPVALAINVLHAVSAKLIVC